LLLKAWSFVNFFLAYIPADFQIHMLNGWQVPIAILAADGIFRDIVPYLNRCRPERWRDVLSGQHVARVVGVAFILLCLPTNLYLLAWRFVELQRHDYPYFLYRDEVTALRWLDNLVDSQDVVLASIEVGRFVPVLAGNRAFLGHWAQTTGNDISREHRPRLTLHPMNQRGI
jgi:hypothetical protein